MDEMRRMGEIGRMDEMRRMDEIGRINETKQMTGEDLIDGRYRAEYLAGNGGFGSLYKGYDLRLEREVAIKVQKTIGEREAMILKQLEHKGLPRIYDICRKADETYLVMEWIPGMDLEKYLEGHGALDEKQAIGIGRELLDILEYFHSLGTPVVYQDLKPANIMIMPDGHIKLVDFGCAFSNKYDDEKKIYAGTVGYGSPEQRGLHGTRFADERSDIYSWGACLYSLISGRSLNKPPYTMDKPRRVCPQLSHSLERIIIRATDRNPGKRYQNVSEIKDALGQMGMVDSIYRILYMLEVFAVTLPLGLSWLSGMKAGVFAGVERVIRLALDEGCGAGRTGLRRIWFSGFWKTLLSGTNWVKNGGFDDSLCRVAGVILICVAWLFGGLKFLTGGKTFKVRRSVFLSDRKYPGLWIGVLLTGIVFGYGMNSLTEAGNVYAAERGEILPVNIVEENGMRTIVRYDAVYYPEGSVLLEIPADELDTEGEKRLTVSLMKEGGGVSSRTFVME